MIDRFGDVGVKAMTSWLSVSPALARSRVNRFGLMIQVALWTILRARALRREQFDCSQSRLRWSVQIRASAGE